MQTILSTPDFSEDFLQQIFKLSAEYAARILLQKVEDIDTMQDTPELRAACIDFFRKTKLNEMSFENTEGDPDFDIVNSTNQQSVAVSNRTSTNSELRGGRLRRLLDAQKKISPNQTIYDAIQNIISNPTSSTITTMLKGMATSAETAEYFSSKPMSSQHFDIFFYNCVRQARLILKDMPNSEDISAVDFQSKLEDDIDFNTLFYAIQLSQTIKTLKLEAGKINPRSREGLAANKCIQTIEQNFKILSNSKSGPQAKLQASRNISDAIHSAQPVLQDYTTWMDCARVLLDALVCVLTLFTAPIIKSLATGYVDGTSFRFFSSANDSKIAQKATELRDEIQALSLGISEQLDKADKKPDAPGGV